MKVEDYYKEDRWWEAYNPSANWEKLYETHPDVNWGNFYSSLPEELLPKEVQNESRG